MGAARSEWWARLATLDGVCRPEDQAAECRGTASPVDPIAYYAFEQFLFDRQWNRIRSLAHRVGVGIIGDLPIYAWQPTARMCGRSRVLQARRERLSNGSGGRTARLFFGHAGSFGTIRSTIGRRLREVVTRGGRSGFGERWIWLMWRGSTTSGIRSLLVGASGEETAVNGRWNPGPRGKLFQAIADDLGKPSTELPLIAEDLGRSHRRGDGLAKRIRASWNAVLCTSSY